MFYKAIRKATLVSEIADRLFLDITATDTPDHSFLATLRALLRTRIPENESVRLYCRTVCITESEISSMAPARLIERFSFETARCSLASEHSISIVSAADAYTGDKLLEKIRANAGAGKRHMDNFTLREDLRVFYAKKMNALFYNDSTGKNTIIFVNNLELNILHALQMMIPKYLPLLFAENPLTEKEIALLKSTGNKGSTEYETLIDEFADVCDFRAEIIRSKLSGFETVFERMKIDELKSEIAVYRSDYDYNLAMMRDLSQKIQDTQYVLAGLESVVGHSGDSELMGYFMCNKNLTLVKVEGTVIEFISHGYADIYDKEAFGQYVSNHNGFMYSRLNTSVTKPQMEMLYRAIFESSIYKLRICAAYIASIQTGLKGISGYTFPSESRTYLPNPHIQTQGCIGGYAGRFQEFIQNRDYVGAIDQAAVSARNLNFYDSSVISSLSKYLSSSTQKCIEAQDGTLLTPIEAINELGGGALCQDQS